MPSATVSRSTGWYWDINFFVLGKISLPGQIKEDEVDSILRVRHWRYLLAILGKIYGVLAQNPEPEQNRDVLPSILAQLSRIERFTSRDRIGH